MRNYLFETTRKGDLMTDKMKVYTKVTKMLKKLMPTASQNHVIVLAMMVAGIVTGRKAQLSEMSLHVPHQAKPESLAKRFGRFVKNKRVEVETLYLPFAQEILAHLSDKPLFLAMDGSQVGRGCMTLMVVVIYGKRAIPLVWIVYKGKKGHTTAEKHIEVLKLVQPLLPTNVPVTLLGDAEYDTVEMLTWMKNNTDWTFIMRTEPRILLTDKEKTYPICDLLAGKNSCTWVEKVLFTKQGFGPVTVIAWWEKPHKKPIYLVSNYLETDKICRFYGKRFKVETLFSDQKSRGFHIEKSHLSEPKRVARLLLATCLAYIWMIYLGVEVSNDHSRRSQIDRTHRTDKSLFRLGLDWLKHALTRNLDFNVLFFPSETPSHLSVR
jgi:hypothetical protein